MCGQPFRPLAKCFLTRFDNQLAFLTTRRNSSKTRKVRFAYKHIATLGPESIRAADRYTHQVKTQTEEAQRLGIRATPGFVINNSITMGAQPHVAFARMINEELDNLGWETPAGQESTSVLDEVKGLIVYPPAPPSDDILNGVWQNCGIYDEAVSIDNVLSSLAPGAVWIAYHSDLPAEQVEVLREVVGQALAERSEPMVILSPGPYTDRKIMATAWQVQLTLDDASDPRLEQFLEKFQVGPFTPEPGEPCSGGVGQPSG